MKLTADQEQAKNLIREWYFNRSDAVFVLAGYAGTGKTFLINYVVKEVLKLKVGEEAVFVSPTGKAATVLAQGGTVAGTVHGLIYIRDEEDFDVDEDGEIVPKNHLSFYKRDSIDEKIRLIVIDEASMVSVEMLRDLLSFGVKCLFCGDNAQLPPVSGDCFLLDNPDYQLTEIVRQAADNPIIRLATMARNGELIPYGEYGDKVSVVSRRFFYGEQRKKALLRANQIICGRNKTRNELNAEMRRYLGVSESPLPLSGEKLICTLNDWEQPLDKEKKFHLVNGIIGRAEEDVEEGMDYLARLVFQADGIGGRVAVPIDTGVFLQKEYAHGYGEKALTLKGGYLVHEGNYEMFRRFKAEKEEVICRFEFAYAITCHKAQGSEFDFAVVFDEAWVFGEEKNRWLYTAITRAKDRLLIVR